MPVTPFIAVLLGLAAPPATPREVRLMDLIEQNVVLPSRAGKLLSYSRRYAWSSDRRKVLALYGPGKGRQWVPDDRLPMISDGGCSFIDLSFDVASGNIEFASCHGHA